MIANHFCLGFFLRGTSVTNRLRGFSKALSRGACREKNRAGRCADLAGRLRTGFAREVRYGPADARGLRVHEQRSSTWTGRTKVTSICIVGVWPLLTRLSESIPIPMSNAVQISPPCMVSLLLSIHHSTGNDSVRDWSSYEQSSSEKSISLLMRSFGLALDMRSRIIFSNSSVLGDFKTGPPSSVFFALFRQKAKRVDFTVPFCALFVNQRGPKKSSLDQTVFSR